ncbi:hypothetical protein [uncultured Brevundimonas sp.]|uniref:hypothetical protein n=1 Tax=uncultured Brevundimonas sp. TaxID=213418 RepID=UPI0030EBFB41|tara:strand:+ start:32946 stop:33194 length:249 start_codon:yes stop_codon:yes gene_type:complete
MISSKFRDGLAAFALLVMIGGSVLAVIAFIGAVALAIGNGVNVASALGHALGSSVRFVGVCILAGGVLRLLVSIDARLEAKS